MTGIFFSDWASQNGKRIAGETEVSPEERAEARWRVLRNEVEYTVLVYSKKDRSAPFVRAVPAQIIEIPEQFARDPKKEEVMNKSYWPCCGAPQHCQALVEGQWVSMTHWNSHDDVIRCPEATAYREICWINYCPEQTVEF